MSYTLATMAYFNLHSEENNKKRFLLLSFLCIYLGHSCSKTHLAKIHCGLMAHSRWAVVDVIKCKYEFFQYSFFKKEANLKAGCVIQMRVLTTRSLNEFFFFLSTNRLLVQVNSISPGRHVTGQGEKMYNRINVKDEV